MSRPEPPSFVGPFAGLSAAQRASRLGAGLLWPLAMAASPLLLQSPTRLACPFLALTGLPCPLCGGTHACAALVQGEWAQAWAANPGAVGLLALLCALALQWVTEGLAGRRRVQPWPWAGPTAQRWVMGWLFVAWAGRLADFF